MVAKLELHFTHDRELALEKVYFSHQLIDGTRFSIRGKLGGAYGGNYTFQWTPAVQALAILLLETRLNRSAEPALLAGGAGSHAASLDYAIGKQPAWLLDMFGVDSQGLAVIRRLVRRTNPERKRGGDVILSINPNQLPKDQIRFFINKIELLVDAELEGLKSKIQTARQANSTSPTRERARLIEMKPAAQNRLPKVLLASFGTSSPQEDIWGRRIQETILSEFIEHRNISIISADAILRAEELRTPIAIVGTRLGCTHALVGRVITNETETEVSCQLISTDNGMIVYAIKRSFITKDLAKGYRKMASELVNSVAKTMLRSEEELLERSAA